MAKSGRLKKISLLFSNMTHPYYVILPIEFTAQGDYASKVNTAMIDSRTCQDLMASDGEAKIFFFPPWVFA